MRGWPAGNPKNIETHDCMFKIWEGLRSKADKDNDGQVNTTSYYYTTNSSRDEYRLLPKGGNFSIKILLNILGCHTLPPLLNLGGKSYMPQHGGKAAKRLKTTALEQYNSTQETWKLSKRGKLHWLAIPPIDGAEPRRCVTWHSGFCFVRIWHPMCTLLKTLKYIIIKMFKYVKYKYIYYFAIPSMILVMFNHKYIRCEGVIIGALN